MSPLEKIIEAIEENLSGFFPLMFFILLISILFMASGGRTIFIDIYFAILAFAAGFTALRMYKNY